MGRNSRSRKIQERKKSKSSADTANTNGASKPEEAAGGSLMAMRSGFKSIVGTEEKAAKGGIMSSILSWVVFLALILALVAFFLAR